MAVQRGTKHFTGLTKGNQAVVRLLELNPNARAGEIAKELKIGERAARKRIHRLMKAEILVEALDVNSEYSQFPAQSLVSIKIALSKLRLGRSPGYNDLRQFVRFLKVSLSKTSEWTRFFRSREGAAVMIQDSYSVAGGGMGVDVVVLIAGTSDALIREFVTDIIGKLRGVDETNTAAIAYDGA